MYHEDELELIKENQDRIDINRYSILQVKIVMVTFFVLLLTLNIGGIIVLKHDMHDCEDRLYNHLVSTDTKSLAQD